MPRTASSASLAMPPPSKVPARPPSVQSGMSSSTDVPPQIPGGSGPTSPRKSVRKVNGNGTVTTSANGNAKGKESAEGPEINIQVVVRCR